MVRKSFVAALCAALFGIIPALTWAQDDAEAFKAEVLKRVDAKLNAQREKILNDVRKLLDEELGTGGDSSVKEYLGKAAERIEKYRESITQALKDQEKYLKQLEGLEDSGQWKETKNELIALTKAVIEEHQRLLKLYDTAKREIDGLASGTKPETTEKPPTKKEALPPGEEMTLEEAALMFDECIDLLKEGKHDEAVDGFKRIASAFPDNELGYTSAYNVACGYALKGEKEQALKWLEKSMDMGFQKFDHIKQDSDLDSLRDEPKYKELMKRETN